MIKLYETGAYYADGKLIPDDGHAAEALAAMGRAVPKEEARKRTIAYSILEAHNTSGNMDDLKIKFDAMASHDITYVGIVQTAARVGHGEVPAALRAHQLPQHPVRGGRHHQRGRPHVRPLRRARSTAASTSRPTMAVIHQYMREMMAGCGKMILGSDSHTRYGALGTMAVGEGGGELVKQLLGRTYDIARPQVVAVYLTGKPQPGVGPQDVALAIIGAVFKNGYVKNKVMEFVGAGHRQPDHRNTATAST